MKIFILLITIFGTLFAQNTTYIGFKDFWPERLDMGGSQAGRGEQLERARTVAERAEEFFAQYPNAEIIDVDYVLYSQFALRNRDQDIENAPLAVNRERDGSNRRNDLRSITNTEVWRYTFRTTDLNTYLAIVPDREERVEASANVLQLSMIMSTMFVGLFF